MNYKNPVLQADYSDPDVIRVDDDFYMVSSSFNHVPGVPVLHSKNLVEWEITGHVLSELPFERFERVCHGAGAWAPSLRYHGGKFYCLIPFPDEGIFVSETEDINGEWSPLRPLVEGSGYEDPCPIWANGRCYVVFAFVKSRIGFNSKLAVFETDENLTTVADKYKIIYDGTNIAPKIEGPKFYKKDDFYYILAPAGGVKTGWQVALRSKSIYGPYETKIVMLQGDTDINGPHQGALVDLKDGGWKFMHFQDMGAYGRVVHLQPVQWADGWPLIGETDGVIAGTPVREGEYPVDISTGYKIDGSDEFEGPALSPVWQTPANPRHGWYEFKRGLKLNCLYNSVNCLWNMPRLIMQKVNYLNFSAKAKCRLNLVNDGDECGFVMFGKEYAYVCVTRIDGRNYLEIRKGGEGKDADETLCRSQPYDEKDVVFQLSAKWEAGNKLAYKFTFGKVAFTHIFYAEKGKWTGAKLGLYAKSACDSEGFATFKFFRVVCTDNRVAKN